MLIYRDVRQNRRTSLLFLQLRQGLVHEDALAALLLAGELECGLADALEDEHPARGLSTALTDNLAVGLLGGKARPNLSALEQCDLPASIQLSPAEGFAYYALHPRAYADLLNSVPRDPHRPVAVVGIRSIGTTLSAVVAAACASQGVSASRITVRPQGHPFDRKLALTPTQQDGLQKALHDRAQFFVVDEGPGLSGSSFLSVGEALIANGVNPADIIFLGSRAADPATLCAQDAARRWSRFRAYAANGTYKPSDAQQWIGGGNWRTALSLDDDQRGIPVWPQTERNKFLSSDGRLLYKFEGLGHYGEAVIERSRLLADAGFAPPIEGFDASTGYAASGIVIGRRACRADLSEGFLLHAAKYCAVRSRMFPADAAGLEECSLAAMTEVNVKKEFDLDCDLGSELETLRPLFCDARMMPCEWIITPSGRWVKTDAASHGDDHFFPGPCDIAWDIAGAMVEWRMPPAAADFFSRRYQQLSGDDVRGRLPAYLLAYAMFRLGFCRMAEAALGADAEAEGFRRAATRYQRAAREQLRGRVPRSAAAQISA
jgi:hypothetical protein